MWWNREPYPVFRTNNNKVLNQKYIFEKDFGVEGQFNVKLMIGKFYRVVENAEVTTIDNHTVVTKYI